jgi:hypothetical protein
MIVLLAFLVGVVLGAVVGAALMLLAVGERDTRRGGYVDLRVRKLP